MDILNEIFTFLFIFTGFSFFILGPILFIVGCFLAFKKACKKKWVEVVGIITKKENKFKKFVYSIVYNLQDVEYTVDLKSSEDIIVGNKVKLLVFSKNKSKVKFNGISKIKYTIGVICMTVGVLMFVFAYPFANFIFSFISFQ